MTRSVAGVLGVVGFASRGTRRETEMLTWLLIVEKALFAGAILAPAIVDARIGGLLSNGTSFLSVRVQDLMRTLQILIMISFPIMIALVMTWSMWFRAVRRNVRDSGGEPRGFTHHRALRIVHAASLGYLVALMIQLSAYGTGTAKAEYAFVAIRVASAILMLGSIAALVVVRRDLRRLPPPPPRPRKGSGSQLRSPGWLSTAEQDVTGYRAS